MSATALSQSEIRDYVRSRQDSPDDEYECATCGGPRQPKTSVKGSFCSTLCAQRHRRQKAARNVLRTVEKDHRFCATCYRRTKEVETPSEKWGRRDDIVGYQYPTEHAEEVWRDRRGRQSTGLGCECGNCQHSHEDETLQGCERLTATHYLTVAIRELRAEGNLDVHVDREQLFSAVIDTGEIRAALEVSLRT